MSADCRRTSACFDLVDRSAELFKDEVREIGRELRLPEAVVSVSRSPVLDSLSGSSAQSPRAVVAVLQKPT